METEMHAEKYSKNGNLIHSTECKMAFGRKDKECARCQELLTGAPARKGWQENYFESRKNGEEEIKQHFQSERHKFGKCGTICTFGDP
jgi:hypothetical protein